MNALDDQAAVRAAIEQHDHAVANLKARCRLAGYSLFIVSATSGRSSFLVQRWGRSRELCDVGDVELFLQQAGAR